MAKEEELPLEAANHAVKNTVADQKDSRSTVMESTTASIAEPLLTGIHQALWQAIKDQNITEVRALIQQGANVNAKDAGKYTCLHLAATLPNADIVQLLLQHGADINATYDSFKQTPLYLAISYGHLENVRAFLQTLNQSSTVTQPEQVVDLTIKDNNGDSVLTFAQWLASNPIAHEKYQPIVIELQAVLDNCLTQAAKEWVIVGANIDTLKKFQPFSPHPKPKRKLNKNRWLVPAILSALGVLGITATVSSILIYVGFIILPFAPPIVTAIMLGMNILGMVILLGTIATTYYLRNKRHYEVIYIKETLEPQLKEAVSAPNFNNDDRQEILTYTPSPLSSPSQSKRDGNEKQDPSSTISDRPESKRF